MRFMLGEEALLLVGARTTERSKQFEDAPVAGEIVTIDAMGPFKRGETFMVRGIQAKLAADVDYLVSNAQHAWPLGVLDHHLGKLQRLDDDADESEDVDLVQECGA